MPNRWSEPPAWLIVPAGEDDLEAAAAIDQQAPSPWTRDQLEGELSQAAGWQFVCRTTDHRKLLGFIMGRSAADEAEIVKLVVAPGYRRLGIAGALLRQALIKLPVIGVSRCFLEVRRRNLPARRLYKKFDFQMTGLRPGYYTDPVEDALCLVRDLTDSTEEAGFHRRPHPDTTGAV